MNDTSLVEASDWVTSRRGPPDAYERKWVADRLGKYPQAAIARMIGRSLAFVQAVAADNPGLRPVEAPPAIVAPPAASAGVAAQPARKWRPSLPPTVRAAVAQVCLQHGVRVSELFSEARLTRVTEARQAAYAAVRALPGPGGRPWSLPQIGAWFGRDHTTVLDGMQAHARRAVARNPVAMRLLCERLAKALEMAV